MSTSFQQGQPIIPRDGIDLPFVAEAISSISGGVVYVDYEGGGTNVPLFLLPGTPYVSRITRVWSTHSRDHDGYKRASGLTGFALVVDAGTSAAVAAAMTSEREQRIAQDQSLSVAVDEESTSRQDADGVLKDQLDALALIVSTAIDSGDGELDQLSEIAAAIVQIRNTASGMTIASVAGLQGFLDSQSQKNVQQDQALVAETNTRMSAIGAIQGELDALALIVSTAIDSGDGELDQLSEIAAAITQIRATANGLVIDSIDGLPAALSQLGENNDDRAAEIKNLEIQTLVDSRGIARNLLPEGFLNANNFAGATQSPEGHLIQSGPVISSDAFEAFPVKGLSYDLKLVLKITAGMVKRPYIGWVFVDDDGLEVQHQHVHFLPASLTTLTAPLSLGDMSAEMADASGFDSTLAISSARLCVSNYIDSMGTEYPKNGYSRHVTTTGFIDSVAGNTITFNSAWSVPNPDDANGVWPVGTPIRQATGGTSYRLFSIPDANLANFWQTAGEYELQYRAIAGEFDGGVPRAEGLGVLLHHFSKITLKVAGYQENISAGAPIAITAFDVQAEDHPLHQQLSDTADISAVVDAWQIEGAAELNRLAYQDGLLAVRQYEYNPTATDERVFDAAYAAGNVHNHADHRNLVGFAEWAAIAHGYFIRARHTDYKTMRAVQGEYLARIETPPPPVPAFVLAKPIGLNTDGTLDLVADTQARWMSELLQGQHNEYLQAQFAFIEIFLEKFGPAGRTDAAASSRHADVSGDLLETLEQNTKLNAAGMQYVVENLGSYPAGVRPMKVDGKTIHDRYAINFRVNTVPIGTGGLFSADEKLPLILIGTSESHAHELSQQLTQQEWDDLRSGAVASVDLTSTDKNHTHIYRITWDAARELLNGQDISTGHQHAVIIPPAWSESVPFDAEKAKNGVIDSSNRFRLVSDPISLKRAGGKDGLINSPLARFDYADIDLAMQQCWGIEGEGSVLEESYLQPNGSTQYLNSIYDPTNTAENASLNAAKYSRSAQTADSNASGRSKVYRGFSAPMTFFAKTTHEEVLGGFSYGIPLQIHFRSPIESWNPAGVPYNSVNDAHTTAPGGGTQSNPYQNAFGKGGFNFTPKEIWGSSNIATDPADTPRVLWMRGADGNAYECTSSGIWTQNPGGVRQSLPIYKTAFEGSHAETHQRAVNRSLKGLLSALVGTAGITQADIDALPIDDLL